MFDVSINVGSEYPETLLDGFFEPEYIDNNPLYPTYDLGYVNVELESKDEDNTDTFDISCNTDVDFNNDEYNIIMNIIRLVQNEILYLVKKIKLSDMKEKINKVLEEDEDSYLHSIEYIWKDKLIDGYRQLKKAITSNYNPKHLFNYDYIQLNIFQTFIRTYFYYDMILQDKDVQFEEFDNIILNPYHIIQSNITSLLLGEIDMKEYLSNISNNVELKKIITNVIKNDKFDYLDKTISNDDIYIKINNNTYYLTYSNDYNELTINYLNKIENVTLSDLVLPILDYVKNRYGDGVKKVIVNFN